MMVPMTDRLVVEIGDCSACPGVQTARVHHPDRVDCHGEGATPHEAIACLLRRLIAERDSLFDTWHRAELEQVIAEVHAALDEDDATEQTTDRAHGPRGLEPTTFEAALSNANGRACGMVRGSIDPGGRTGGLDAGSLGRLLVPGAGDELYLDFRGGLRWRIQVENVEDGRNVRFRAWPAPALNPSA